jgi:hypothetical protein
MAEAPLPSYELDLDLLRTAAVTAGIIASSYFRRDLKTWTKENASPVSEADIVPDHGPAALWLAQRGERRRSGSHRQTSDLRRRSD